MLNLVGFYTHSLALVADAFHYVRTHATPACGELRSARLIRMQLNDLVGFVVALVAYKVRLP